MNFVSRPEKRSVRIYSLGEHVFHRTRAIVAHPWDHVRIGVEPDWASGADDVLFAPSILLLLAFAEDNSRIEGRG